MAFSRLPQFEQSQSALPPESNLSRIVGPMEQGLALFAAAGEISGAAVFQYLREVPPYGPPTADLTLIIGAATA